jgi:hypothetical protein
VKYDRYAFEVKPSGDVVFYPIEVSDDGTVSVITGLSLLTSFESLIEKGARHFHAYPFEGENK